MVSLEMRWFLAYLHVVCNFFNLFSKFIFPCGSDNPVINPSTGSGSSESPHLGIGRAAIISYISFYFIPPTKATEGTLSLSSLSCFFQKLVHMRSLVQSHTSMLSNRIVHTFPSGGQVRDTPVQSHKFYRASLPCHSLGLGLSSCLKFRNRGGFLFKGSGLGFSAERKRHQSKFSRESTNKGVTYTAFLTSSAITFIQWLMSGRKYWHGIGAPAFSVDVHSVIEFRFRSCRYENFEVMRWLQALEGSDMA